MASKKTKKSIQVKLNVKKPIKTAKKAAEEAARIKKNEQSRLYRLNNKFKATKKKGEADKLRREIRSLEKDLKGISGVLSTIRSKAKQIDAEKRQIKSLKIQNAAITRKLNKKAESGKKGFDAEYTALSKQHIKNTGLIQERIQKAAALTYQINKDLGFDPEVIAKNIEISNRTLEKEFNSDFNEEYFETGPGRSKLKEEEDIIEEYSEESEESEERLKETDFTIVDADVFWKMWKNFEDIEKFNLQNYTDVIFDFGGMVSKYKGTSASLILMKSSEMWRYARLIGSDCIVEKWKTINDKKLKYIINEG